MKNLSRTLALMLTLCVIFGSVVSSSAVIDPSSAFYVTDLTKNDVISSATEKYIVAMNERLEKQTGAQIVIAAVDFIDGADIEDYSYKVYNDWKIGSAELNNGLLILLVIGEQNYWGVQGAGIRDVLTSSLIADYLNTYLEPDFAAARYDSGVRAVFDAFISWYSTYYGVTVSVSEELSKPPVQTAPTVPSNNSTETDEDKPSRAETLLAAGFVIGKIARWFLITLAVFIIVTATLMVVLRRRNKVRSGAASTFIPRLHLFRRRRLRKARRAKKSPPPPPNVNPYSGYSRGGSPDGQYSYVRPKNGTTNVRSGYNSGFSGEYHTPKNGGKSSPPPPKNHNVRPSNKYDNLFRFNGFNPAPGPRPNNNRSNTSGSRQTFNSKPSAPHFGGFSGGSSRHSAPSRSTPGRGGFTRGGGAGRKK